MRRRFSRSHRSAVADRFLELFGRAFLFQEIEDAEFHRPDGRGHVGLGGDHDHGKLSAAAAEPLQPWQAVLGVSRQFGHHARRSGGRRRVEELADRAADFQRDSQRLESCGQIAQGRRLTGDQEDHRRTVHGNGPRIEVPRTRIELVTYGLGNRCSIP